MEANSPKLFMTFNSEFTGIRVLNRTLIPTKWKVEADFVSNEDFDAEKSKEYNEGSITYQILDFWMTQLLDDVLVVNPLDPFSLDLALSANNFCMTIPGTPTDDLIIQALFEKMNAICKNHLQILKLSITSVDSGATYHFVDTINNSNLPDISYVGEDVHTEFKTPWWTRTTACCSDFPVEEDDEDVTEIDFVKEKDVLDHYEEQLRNMMNGNDEGSVVYTTTDGSEVDLSFAPNPSNEDEDDPSHDVIEPEWDKK